MANLQEHYDIDEAILTEIKAIIPDRQQCDFVNHWLADGLRRYKRDVLGLDVKMTGTEMLRAMRDGYIPSEDVPEERTIK